MNSITVAGVGVGSRGRRQKREDEEDAGRSGARRRHSRPLPLPCSPSSPPPSPSAGAKKSLSDRSACSSTISHDHGDRHGTNALLYPSAPAHARGCSVVSAKLNSSLSLSLSASLCCAVWAHGGLYLNAAAGGGEGRG